MREPANLSRRTAAALPLVRPAASAQPALARGDDAALVDLGHRWIQACAKLREHDRLVEVIADDATFQEQELISDRLFAAEQKLFDAIIVTPARTLRGLAVKAQALARAHDIEPGIEPLEAALALEPTSLERSAAFALALDILRLARTAS